MSSDDDDEPCLGYMFDAAAESEVREMVIDGVRFKYVSSKEEVGSTSVQGGHAVWLGAKLLSEWCARQAVDSVLELGCGIGLVGLTCAAFGAERVILTDRDEGALALVQDGIAANRGFAEKCAVQRLLFGDEWTGDKVNLVLAADVIYSSGMIESVCRTAASGLKAGGVFVLAASFDLGLDFESELYDACRANKLKLPVLCTLKDQPKDCKIWRMVSLGTSRGLVDQVCMNQARAFTLQPRAFLPAWGGAITLAFRGWPEQVLEFKEAIEGIVPGLSPENPGSKWPKITLGASVSKLDLSQLQLLDAILREDFSPKLSDRSLSWCVDTLWLTVYATGSHEELFSRKALPSACETRSSLVDESTVPTSEINRVEGIIAESSTDIQGYLSAFNGKNTQWDAGETNADRYLRPGRPGVSVVAFLHQKEEEDSHPLLGIIKELRHRTDTALPGVFRWFQDEALHCSLRSLIMSSD